MAAPTREELQAADESMQRAGYDENERLSVLLQLQEYQVPDVPGFMQPFESPTTKSGRDLYGAANVILPATGAALGGTAASMLGSRVIPKAMPYVGPLVSGAGQAGGAFLGSLPGVATGQQTLGEAATGSAIAGGIGAGAEYGLNLLTRFLGSLGGVEAPAVNRALSRGPVGAAKTVFGKPPVTAEAELGGKLGTSIEPKNIGITEGRISTIEQLEEMAKRGQMVDMTPTMGALDQVIGKLQQKGIGSDARAALKKLTSLRNDIASKYLQAGQQPPPSSMGTGKSIPPKIAVTPQDADMINKQIGDAVGDAFGKPGGTTVKQSLKGVSATHTQSFRSQTGTAESAAATARRMDAIETLRTHLSEKTPEGFVRSVGRVLETGGESGGQSALIALREFDPSGKWEKKILDLAAKRDWTATTQRAAQNIKWELLRRLPRFGAKLTAVAARPTGSTAAAASAAFYNAMNNP